MRNLLYISVVLAVLGLARGGHSDELAPRGYDTTSGQLKTAKSTDDLRIGGFDDEVSYVTVTEAADAWTIIKEDNVIVSGCGVTWDTGLVFDVEAGVYYISGTRYEASVADTVTLDASDPALDRIDVIAYDTSDPPNAVFIKGTAAADPVKPDVDEQSYIELTFVLIAGGASVPTITKEKLYFDTLTPPPTWSPTVGSWMVLDSTEDAYEGTKSIKYNSMAGGAGVSFSRSPVWTDGATVNAYDVFHFWFKPISMGKNRTIDIWFRSSSPTTWDSTIVSVKSGKYGFDSSDSSWQHIIIPIGDFGIDPSIPNFVIIYMFGGGSGATWTGFIDAVEIQQGIPSESPTVDRWFYVVADTGDTYADTEFDSLSFIGGTGITTSIADGTDVVTITNDVGAGVTDHGALTGLDPDDDHPQYHNDTRGDLRYLMLNASNDPLTGELTTQEIVTQAGYGLTVGAGGGIDLGDGADILVTSGGTVDLGSTVDPFAEGHFDEVVIGGATIGTNALAVDGDVQVTGDTVFVAASNIAIGQAIGTHPLMITRDQNSATRIQVTNPNTGAAADTGIQFQQDGEYGYIRRMSENYASYSWGDAMVLQVGTTVDNGIVLYSADKVRLQTTPGTDALIVDSAGDVGIGATPGGMDLKIKRAGNAYVSIDGGTGSYTGLIYEANDGYKWQITQMPSTTGYDLRFYSYGLDTGADEVGLIDMDKGEWNIGDSAISNNAAMLHVVTASAYGNVVLELDQLDIDQPFIDFDGTTTGDPPDEDPSSIHTFKPAGDVTGPNWNSGGGYGYDFEGVVRVEINNADMFVPYYSYSGY